MHVDERQRLPRRWFGGRRLQGQRLKQCPATAFIAVVLAVVVLAGSQPAEAFLDAILGGLEESIGASVHQQLVQEHGVVRISEANQRYLERILHDLVAVSNRQDVTYRLTVLNAREVNAFAAPGGYLYVTLPFLRFVESTEELAGVLGHEIAHVDRKHGINSLQRELGTALVLQLLFGRADSKTLDTIVSIVMARIRSGWSQEQEFEADEYGARFAAAAGYGVDGLMTFLKRMQAAYGGSDDDLLARWFSTHPPTGDRIRRLESLKGTLKTAPRAEPIPPLPKNW